MFICMSKPHMLTFVYPTSDCSATQSGVPLNSLTQAVTAVFNDDSVSMTTLLVATEPREVGLCGWTFARLLVTHSAACLSEGK